MLTLSIESSWKSRFFLSPFLLFLSVFCYAQEPWELRKDQNGIKVYTRSVEGADVKEVKVTLSLAASFTELAALLMDASAHEQWVYNTRRSYVVQQVHQQRQIYYSETKLPWPMGNRDVVAELIISQDAITKVMIVTCVSVDGIVPEKKGIVRVPMSQVKWIVTPNAEGGVDIEYTAQADPAGSMPAWLANAFITKGPYETFLKLKEVIKQGRYRGVQFASIRN